MAVLSMSKQEFSRLEVLLRVQSGWLRVADACALIGLGRRQVFRLLRNLERDGAPSLLSKRRGKPSNHRLAAEVRSLALSIVRERYADFSPTFAAEKLAELHGCSISRETLRGKPLPIPIPAYQPICPLCVDGPAGEAGGTCGSAAQRADHAAYVAPVVGGPAEGPEVVGQMLG